MKMIERPENFSDALKKDKHFYIERDEQTEGWWQFLVQKLNFVTCWVMKKTVKKKKKDWK